MAKPGAPKGKRGSVPNLLELNKPKTSKMDVARDVPKTAGSIGSSVPAAPPSDKNMAGKAQPKQPKLKSEPIPMRKNK